MGWPLKAFLTLLATIVVLPIPFGGVLLGFAIYFLWFRRKR